MSFGMGMKEKQTNPTDSHPKNWKANMTAGSDEIKIATPSLFFFFGGLLA